MPGPIEASLAAALLSLKHVLFIIVLVALGLLCCTWIFSSCSAGASHCAGFSFCKAQTVGLGVVAAHGVPGYGLQALELWLSTCGDPVSASLAVEFLTTLPPGMSGTTVLVFIMVN